MGAFTDATELALLSFFFKAGALSPPAGGVYAALHIGDPGESMALTECTGTSYARVQVPPASWATPSSGSITTTADVVFAAAGSNWGTVTHVSFWSASTAGTPYFYGALPVAKTVSTGDVFRFFAGNLTVVLD